MSSWGHSNHIFDGLQCTRSQNFLYPGTSHLQECLSCRFHSMSWFYSFHVRFHQGTPKNFKVDLVFISTPRVGHLLKYFYGIRKTSVFLYWVIICFLYPFIHFLQFSICLSEIVLTFLSVINRFVSSVSKHRGAKRLETLFKW